MCICPSIYIYLHIFACICIYDLSSHPCFLFTAPAKTLCGEMIHGVGGVLLILLDTCVYNTYAYIHINIHIYIYRYIERRQTDR